MHYFCIHEQLPWLFYKVHITSQEVQQESTYIPTRNSLNGEILIDSCFFN